MKIMDRLRRFLGENKYYLERIKVEHLSYVGIDAGKGFVNVISKYLDNLDIEDSNYIISLFQYGIKNIKHDWATDTKKYFNDKSNICNCEEKIQEILDNEKIYIRLENHMKEINFLFYKELNSDNGSYIVNSSYGIGDKDRANSIENTMLSNLGSWPLYTFQYILDGYKNLNTVKKTAVDNETLRVKYFTDKLILPTYEDIENQGMF